MAAQIAMAKRALKLQRHGAIDTDDIDTAPSTDLGTAFRAVLHRLSQEDLKAVSNHIESMDRYWPHPCPQWPHSKHLDTNAYVCVEVERAPAKPPNFFGIVYNKLGFPVYYVCRKEGIEEALKEQGLPYKRGWQTAFKRELLSPFDECEFVAMQEDKPMAPLPLSAVPAVLSDVFPDSETESDDDYPEAQKTDMPRVPEQVHEDAEHLAPEEAEQKACEKCLNDVVNRVALAAARIQKDAGAAHQDPQTRTQTPARRKLQEVDEELRNAKQNVQAACAELDVGQRNYERYEEARRACKQPEADEQEVLEKLEIVRAEEEICKSQMLAIQRQCKADLLAMQRKLAKIRREKESFEEAADWAAVSRELAQNNARNCSSPPPVREQEALKRAEQERMRLEGQQRRMEQLVQHEGSTPFDEHQVLAVLEDDGGDEPGAGGSEESEEESEESGEESEEPEAEPEGDITAQCLGKIVYLTGHAHAHTHSHTQICSSNFNNSQTRFSTKTTDARRRKRRNEKVADSPST